MKPAQLQADSQTGSGQDVAFAFVRALAAELSAGTQELPGYPAAIARLQQMLQDDNLELSRLLEALRCEPVVAGQILRMANSVALNPSHVPVIDLRSAVSRVGLNAVRTATVASGMGRLREAPELRGLEDRLEALWRRNVQVASLCQALARRFTQLNAEAAMLAGLLQGVGKLYILARASQHRALFSDEEAYAAIERTWHVSIATALIESWGMPSEIVEAVRDSEDLQREPRGAPTMGDVLSAAALLVECDGGPDLLQSHVLAARPLRRLGLDYDKCVEFMQAAMQEVAALREALSG